VGLYARVSTNDQQTIPSQIRAMREYVSESEIARREEIGRTAVRQIQDNPVSPRNRATKPAESQPSRLPFELSASG